MQKKNLVIIILIASFLIPSLVTYAVKPYKGNVTLTKAYAGTMSTNPNSPYRWMDIANNLYSTNYRETYDYDQATVTVSYHDRGEQFTGTLEATNLKPNFAYQLKLIGKPIEDPAANELIGYTGRWWQETWDGTQWTNGHNLNSKGDGSSPNPNDLVYEATKDTPDPTGTSPTGKLYKYTGYLVFDYFTTDASGNVIISFEQDSSYHVIFKTTQRTPTTDDGPTLTTTFDPDATQTSYDSDYAIATVGIFGEWERLPIGETTLPDGTYNCIIFLTEESFHSTDDYGGNWGAAVEGDISFQITTKTTEKVHPEHPPHPIK